jgi:hypothetical protein
MKIKLSPVIASIAISFFFSISCFAQQEQPDSAKINALIKDGMAAFKKNDYAGAAEIGKQVIAAGHRDSTIYFMTSFALGMAGNKAEARLYYDTSVAKGHDANADDPMVNWVIGVDKPAASAINIDSAFAAIHADAVKKSKHPPPTYSNAKLYQIYLEDQSERILLINQGMGKSMNMDILMRMNTNDGVRKAEVYKLIPKLMKTKSTGDLDAATIILQHGNDTSDFWHAHLLALRAISLGDSGARQNAAITLDRYLVNKGKPQLYGTQGFMNDKTGKYELYPVDPSITDEERAKWDEPPLKNQLDRLNAVYGTPK